MQAQEGGGGIAPNHSQPRRQNWVRWQHHAADQKHFSDYTYQICDKYINCSAPITDLGIFSDSSVFYYHVNYTFLQSLKLLETSPTLIISSSADYCLLLICCTLDLEYVSLVWNNITFSNANKLKRIQRCFGAPCFSFFVYFILYQLHVGS